MMIRRILVLVFIFGCTINILQAQADPKCRDFLKKGFAFLDTAIYYHDGRYNAIKLSQGDNVDVYKPFYRDRKYKIVVFSEENISTLKFKVINIQRQVVYESKNLENTQIWEYIPDKNQNLVISVEIPKPDDLQGNPNSGCVIVLIGYHK